MDNKEIEYLPNGFFNELKIIRNISFTAREIDVIACIIHMRGYSKIASLLNISPKTAEAHIANIKRKVEYNAREGIIDFIESSGKISTVRKHYKHLLTQLCFYKKLKNISMLIGKNAPTCYFFCSKEKAKIPLIKQILNHLKLATINVKHFAHEIELTESKSNEHFIYVMFEQDSQKTMTFKARQIAVVTPAFFTFLVLENIKVGLAKSLNKAQCINYVEQENYYYFIFAILKKLLYPLNIDEYIYSFKQQYAITLQDESLHQKPALKTNQHIINNHRFILLATGIFGIFIAWWLFLYLGNKAIKPEESPAKRAFILFNKNNNQFIEWNLPRQDHIFVGRKELLEELENKLHLNLNKNQDTKINAYPHELFTVSVCSGLGGVGKTQLALQYMRHSKHPYTLRAWFLAENIDHLKQQYIEFAKTIGYKDYEPTIETALPYIENWLSKNPGWLLVYDNVSDYETIKKFLPNSGGHVVLTTRQRKWPNTFKTLDIDIMNEEESITLMQSLIEREITIAEIKSEKELVKMLGYLPLALAHAGAYIRQNAISITDYLELYRHNEQQLLADNTLPQGTNSLPIAVTWNISLEAIVKESQAINQPPLALHLLSVCSYLAPDKIPKNLLLAWLKKSYPNLPSPEILLQKLINQLWQYSIINSGDKDISIHRLVQAVIRLQHKKLFKKKGAYYPPLTLGWYSKLLKSVHNEFYRKTQTLEDEMRKELIFPHLQTLVVHHEQLWLKQSTKALGEILFDIASVLLYNRGDAESAKFYYERALVIFEQRYGKEHAQIAITLNNLANAYGDLGDSKRQKELLERALKIFEQNYGKKRTQIAITLTNLANAYGDLGNYQYQKELLERALIIFEEHYGKNHSQVAITMANLGNACGDLGDSKRQKEFLEKALAIFEREYGGHHVQVASALVSLGSAYGDLGNYQRKKELLERALNIEEQHYGKEHIEVATTLVNFANAYGILGDAKQQKEILERALAIFERNYGKEHVQTAITMTNLANAYGDLGDYRRQKTILEYALAIEEHYYGKDHMEVGITLNNLGNAYGFLGYFERQKELLERALKIKENYFGKEHTEVAITLINLGSAYGMLGNVRQQMEVLEHALSIFERCYGKEHIQVAMTLNNLSNAYGALGDYKAQKELLERALKIEENYYGKEHPRVSFSLTNLGSINGSLYSIKQQKKLLERALRIKENYFGKDHLQVGITVANLANIYSFSKDYKRQIKLLICALTILENYYRKDHIILAPTLYNLSIVYINLKELSNAYDISKRCYNIYYKAYGPEHDDTKDAFNLVETIDNLSSRPSPLHKMPLLMTKQTRNDQLQAHYQIPHGKDRMLAGLDLFQEMEI